MDKLNRLAELTAAAGIGLFPTHQQAARLFSEITGWPAALEKKPTRDSLSAFFQRNAQKRFLSSAASALARVVVPSLAEQDRTEKRASEIIAFLTVPSTSGAMPALPYFAHLGAVQPEIIRRVRRAIAGRRFEEVAGGATAITTWASLFPLASADALPERVIEQLVSTIEARQSAGLHVLTDCACKLLELNRLRQGDGPRLEETLGDLLAETSYEKVDFDKRSGTSISLLRASCVRTRSSFEKLGQWRRQCRGVAERRSL